MPDLVQSIGQSNAKAILLGEHSVVYGYPAIAIPLTSLQLTVTISPSETTDEPYLITDSYQGLFSEAPQEFSGIHFLVHTFLKNQPCYLTYTSSIPQGRGLGSSAASSYATLRALNRYCHLQLTLEQMTQYGNQAEDITHGKASGLDLATIMREQPIYFDEHHHFHPLLQHIGAWLVIADSGTYGHTKEAVLSVHDQILHDGKQKECDCLGSLARYGKEAWDHHNIPELGKLFNQAHQILTDFHLSTPVLETLIHAAQESGALGAKLSGSGLGGIIIALADTAEKAQHIYHALQPLAAHVWIEEI